MTDLPDNPDGMTTLDLDQPATRRDILELRGEIADLRTEITAALEGQIAALRLHFDVVAESFKADFRNLFDWTQATTASGGARLDTIERDHGNRLSGLELRVASLENTPR